MKFEIIKESQIERTFRVESLGSMFDVPIENKLSVRISGDIDLEEQSWNVGLIVGPSGCGKTLTLEKLFGVPKELTWNSRSVIDDFESGSTESIANVCSSVGFSTIPAWIRPYNVLSNGEKFRASVARRLLAHNSEPICIDEFTSVVDRQIAQITSHSVQKYVREKNLKFVAASCHYDIIDWLQPDWILEPGDPSKLTWRSLQRRPSITVSISRIKYEAWELFKNFHYMTPELNKAARCYGLFVQEMRVDDTDSSRIQSLLPKLYKHSDSGIRFCNRNENVTRSRIASFLGTLHRPHAIVNDIIGVSRVVTLPDWQGLGLAYVLTETVAAAYKALGKRFHNYPNHPSFVRGHQRSKNWLQIKDAGVFSPSHGRTSTVGGFGGKKCAVFMYIGSPLDRSEAERLISSE